MRVERRLSSSVAECGELLGHSDFRAPSPDDQGVSLVFTAMVAKIAKGLLLSEGGFDPPLR